jgi:hypothetical protein
VRADADLLSMQETAETSVESAKNYASLSRQFAGSVDRPFQFDKRGQPFIGTHNETLSVVAMWVNYARHNSPTNLIPKITRGL